MVTAYFLSTTYNNKSSYHAPSTCTSTQNHPCTKLIYGYANFFLISTILLFGLFTTLFTLGQTGGFADKGQEFLAAHVGT